jgi:hypothetical protein
MEQALFSAFTTSNRRATLADLFSDSLVISLDNATILI